MRTSVPEQGSASRAASTASPWVGSNPASSCTALRERVGSAWRFLEHPWQTPASHESADGSWPTDSGTLLFAQSGPTNEWIVVAPAPSWTAAIPVSVVTATRAERRRAQAHRTCTRRDLPVPPYAQGGGLAYRELCDNVTLLRIQRFHASCGVHDEQGRAFKGQTLGETRTAYITTTGKTTPTSPCLLLRIQLCDSFGRLLHQVQHFRGVRRDDV